MHPQHRPTAPTLTASDITLAAGILSLLGIGYLIERTRRLRGLMRRKSFPVDDCSILQRVPLLAFALLLAGSSVQAMPCLTTEEILKRDGELPVWRDDDTTPPKGILVRPSSVWACDITAPPAPVQHEATFADAPRILLGVMADTNAIAWSFTALLLALFIAAMGTAFTFGRHWGHCMGHNEGWTNRDELAALQEKAQQDKWEAEHGLDSLDTAQASA